MSEVTLLFTGTLLFTYGLIWVPLWDPPGFILAWVIILATILPFVLGWRLSNHYRKEGISWR